jgi:enolase
VWVAEPVAIQDSLEDPVAAVPVPMVLIMQVVPQWPVQAAHFMVMPVVPVTLAIQAAVLTINVVEVEVAQVLLEPTALDQVGHKAELEYTLRPLQLTEPVDILVVAVAEVDTKACLEVKLGMVQPVV